jgi:hypothetical protein
LLWPQPQFLNFFFCNLEIYLEVKYFFMSEIKLCPTFLGAETAVMIWLLFILSKIKDFVILFILSFFIVFRHFFADKYDDINIIRIE